MLRIHQEEAAREEKVVEMSLDELAREGARRMILAALEIEVEEYVSRLRDERDEHGHAQITRNGKARPRKLTVGPVCVSAQADRER
jgi:putative transposase